MSIIKLEELKFTPPIDGEDHCPCRLRSKGELSSPMPVPVYLFTARKAGERGDGTVR